MAISQLIILTSLTEEFTVSAEESRVAYRSSDKYNCSMHWHFVTRSSFHSSRVGVQKKSYHYWKGEVSLAIILLNLLPYMHRLPQMSDEQAVADTFFMLIFPDELSLTNLTKQFRYSQLLHISALHASAGLSNICSFRSLPSVACCVEVHVWQYLCTATRAGNKLIHLQWGLQCDHYPHSMQEEYMYCNPSFFVWNWY